MKQFTISLAGASLVAAGAQAGEMTIVNPPRYDEASHAEILSDVFGGTFVADGLDFTNNAGVVVTRVSDDDDQTYDFESWSAEVLASWAAASQSFGTLSDGSLVDAVGSFGLASGEVSDGTGGNGIEFARFGDDVWTLDVTTNPESNPGGIDHVVTYTYSVDGQEQEGAYLLFFEDQMAKDSDYDYNDLVVKVLGQSGDPVPEPASLSLLAIGGLAMMRRRR